MDVETETSQYWAKDVDTETPLRLSLISATTEDVKEEFKEANRAVEKWITWVNAYFNVEITNEFENAMKF